jgi:hypothetical protein
MSEIARLAHEQLEEEIVLQVVSNREISSPGVVADMSAVANPETLITTVSRILRSPVERLHDGC